MPARHLPQQRRPKTGKKLCRIPPLGNPSNSTPPTSPAARASPAHHAPSPAPAFGTLPATPCDTSRLTTTPALSSAPPARHTRPIPRPRHTRHLHTCALPPYRPGQTASSARTAEAEDIRKNFNKILKNLPVSYSRPNRLVFRQPEAKNDRGIRYCHLKPKQGAKKISRGGRKIPFAVNNLTINLYICDIVFKPH